MCITNPKVTVLMPAYNAGRFIGEAIESILAQSFTDYELLIVNDGSTDDTLEVIGSFNDERIVLINQENAGVASALNTGLSHSKAPYIARFDADDICYHHRLKVQFDFITSYPEYNIIGTNAMYVDVEGNYLFNFKSPALTNEDIQRLNYRICPFIHSSVMYKKDIVVNNGGYNLYAYTFEDHFLWRNILKKGKAWIIPEPMIKISLNPGSVTIDEKWRPFKFRRLKYAALKTAAITRSQGDQLHKIGEKQYNNKVKEGAYYALCAKKYLLNNFKPKKARVHIVNAIGCRPLRLENYLLYAVSFLPKQMINRLHDIIPA